MSQTSNRPSAKMADNLILLSAFKLASLASFKEKYSLIFELKNEVSEANLNAKQKILKCQPFWHRVYRPKECLRRR